MTSTDRIRPGAIADAPAIAALHAESIAVGFLVVLGEPFLERLYRRVAVEDGSFVLVHEDASGRVNGFVAAAQNTHHLYREFVWHDGLQAAVRAAPAVLRHPLKVLETFRYGMSGSSGAPGAEILATAVARDAQGEGIGTALVAAAIDVLRDRGITHAHVVTAADNDAAQRAYFAAGFRRHDLVEVHRGVTQEVLVWP
jgi:ribosomal protein S18 acetylase RimI-like enzyme